MHTFSLVLPRLNQKNLFFPLLAMLVMGSPAQAAIDPVTAGVASGLAVELIKGIAASVTGDDVAQVQVRSKTDGPDGDDKAFEGETDKDNLWFEYYLDARARAEAAQVKPHFAHGELHYEYTSGKGWRPNNVAYITKKEWWGAAVAYPDSTPVAGSDNKTEAATVGAFAWNGTIEFGGYIDTSKKIVEVPKAAAALAAPDKVQATNVVLLNFDSTQFRLLDHPTDPDKILVAPEDPSLLGTINLFHNYASYSSPEYFYSGITGFNDASNPLIADIEAATAGESGWPSASASERADLTFGSAAIEFNEVFLPRFKVVGSDLVEKSREELLAEYFDQLAIGPTANSQTDYSPSVLYRTTLLNGSLLPLSGLGSDWTDRLPSVFDGDIGLFFAVDSFLEDAVNLAAETEGSALHAFFSGLDADDTFNIALHYGTGESFLYTDQNAVPEPSTLALLFSGLLGALRHRKIVKN